MHCTGAIPDAPCTEQGAGNGGHDDDGVQGPTDVEPTHPCAGRPGCAATVCLYVGCDRSHVLGGGVPTRDVFSEQELVTAAGFPEITTEDLAWTTSSERARRRRRRPSSTTSPTATSTGSVRPGEFHVQLHIPQRHARRSVAGQHASQHNDDAGACHAATTAHSLLTAVTRPCSVPQPCLRTLALVVGRCRWLVWASCRVG